MELFKARRKYLTIVKGRPAVGKTTAALLDLMNRVYLKDEIMFIEYEYAQTLLYSKLTNYFDFDLKELTNVNVVDGLNYSLEMIEELIKTKKPAFVYIDYAGLIEDELKDERTRDEFFYETCNRLSNLAASRNLSIILIAQQSRDYEHGRKVETAFTGTQGFEKVLTNADVDNIIPMFIECDLEPEKRERTILLFSKNGEYEKYSSFNLNDIYKGGIQK